MLTKYERKSHRVKGLSFHPTRPWVLASLHNGHIQLCDYRVKTLVDKFEEHDGPVRGISFHPTQPLFVSGGDDYKIKVWNYKQRRCLFTLMGHLDYIRTVEFHREYPWILSASDDQTIRIWNWQSRTCIAVLTGHNHYVMCASFHPKEDLVVSASLDQTVRVWDISGLRKKFYPGSGGMGGGMSGLGLPMGMGGDSDSLKLPQNELFGNTDAMVKYVLEGHDRGVNWAAFHPTSPLIVSGADDRQVKLWRTNETKAWEVDTFRGHFNNVSCALFHPRQELIISNSEDKTIRVWDIQKRTGISTFRREHDRFWILAAHPEMNLFAAGHDNGMIVFKLERERPPYIANINDSLFYVKDKFLRICQFSTNRDIPVLSLKGTGSRGSGSSGRIKALSYSSQDKAVVMTTDADGGQYELYIIPLDGKGGENVESKKGLGVAAVFVGRKRFAVLDKSQQIIVKNLKNEETKRTPTPYTADNMFAGGIAGQVLLKCEEKVVQFDIQQRKIIGEITIPDVKFVYWSFDGQSPLVALVAKDTIIIANKKLDQLCTVHETIRIKSGAWDENGIFIYSTLNHIKYCLPNGDNGIVRTLDAPIYITAIKGNKVFCLDRDSKIRVISVDTTEYMFKYSLIVRKYNTVLKMVKEYNLIGHSIIAYLQKKGFPEVALFFVKDPQTRFNLALESGNIEVALETAKVIDDQDSWLRLGTEALRQGNHQIVELAYQRTRNFERISFLYLITGNIDKLKKMVKISQMRNDLMSRFHNALYLGDVEERIKVLEDVGPALLPLAYVTAVAHDLQEHAQSIAAKLASTHPNIASDLPSLLSESNLNIDILSASKLLSPPIPIMKLHESNWPLLNVAKGYFDGAALGDEDKHSKLAAEPTEEGAEGGWDDGTLDEEEQKEKEGGGGGWGEEDIETETTTNGKEEGEGTAWDLELEIEDVKVDTKTTQKGTDKAFVVLPSPGPSFSQIWTSNSNLAADHASAGSFESAMRLLNQQVGIVNFEPLKNFMMTLYIGSKFNLIGVASIPSVTIPNLRNATDSNYTGPRNGLPSIGANNLQSIIENKLKAAYKSTTSGKFSEALSHFVFILQALLFVVADSKKEVSEAKELLGICREYITGLRMEIKRKDEDSVRQAELAAYFTHCNLQPSHLALTLSSAMKCAFKIKNFITAASFARRLLELEPKNDTATQAKKVILHAEQNNENANKLNYNDKNPFVVCGISFTPIYKGNPQALCPYCQASFLPQHKGKLCPTCQLAQIGHEATGLQLFQSVSSKSSKE